MSSEMRELVQDVRNRFFWRVSPDDKRNHLIDDDAVRAVVSLCDALLARTEAGADECEVCKGAGTVDEMLGGYAFSNPKATCPECDGLGEYTHPKNAAPVADGLYAWVRESPRHWERVTESDLSQPADPQKMRADRWFPVYTHPQDASGDAAKLGAFAASILNLDEDWIGDVDGGTLQDAAEKHGLLQPVEVTESCGENCACAGYGDFPQTCYRPTETMKRAIAAMQAKEAK